MIIDIFFYWIQFLYVIFVYIFNTFLTIWFKKIKDKQWGEIFLSFSLPSVQFLPIENQQFCLLIGAAGIFMYSQA